MGEILNDRQLVELRYRSGLDAFDSWSHPERVALLDTCGHWQQRAEAAEQRAEQAESERRDMLALLKEAEPFCPHDPVSNPIGTRIEQTLRESGAMQ